MKMQLLIPMVTVLASSFANAYIICKGKNVVAQVAAGTNGLELVGSKYGQEAGMAFVGVIKRRGMIFNGQGRGMKDLKAVFATDSFDRYEAGLDISRGMFYINQFGTSKVLLHDENMKCEFSDGE